MIDRAAALTYYMMMSLFPALLVGDLAARPARRQSLVTEAVDYASDNGAPAEVTDALDALLTKTVEAPAARSSIALVFGIAVALYGASGAFGAAGRALNVRLRRRGDARLSHAQARRHRLHDRRRSCSRSSRSSRSSSAAASPATCSARSGSATPPRRSGGSRAGPSRSARCWRCTRSCSRSRPTSTRGGGGSSAPAGSSASRSGSSPRPASSSTSRTSASTARRTARSPAR